MTDKLEPTQALEQEAVDAANAFLGWRPDMTILSDIHRRDRDRLAQAFVDFAEGLPSPSKWRCAALASSTGPNEPQDCDWPTCGCDPDASKVIEALEESGTLRTAHSGEGRNYGAGEDALREALKPFAAVCDAFDYWIPEVMPDMRYPVAGTDLSLAMVDCPAAIGNLTEEDFRRARYALATHQGEGKREALRELALAAAIAPFAAIAAKVHPDIPDNSIVGRFDFTAGDYRRACAALAQPEAGGERA